MLAHSCILFGVVHVDASCLCLEELAVAGTLVVAIAGVVGETSCFCVLVCVDFTCWLFILLTNKQK